MIQSKVTVEHEHGLHARVAMLVCKAADGFASQITLHYKDKVADAKDILQVMSLGACEGTEITIQIEGDDEAEAMAGMQDVFLHPVQT